MDRVIISWRAMAVFCALIVAAFGFAFWNNRQAYDQAAAQETALQQTLTRLQNDQLSLTGQIKEIGTSSYIESKARSDYAFLKPGELRFEIVNPEVLEGYTRDEMKIVMDEMTFN